MEIKTCEQYVLNKLDEAENALDEAQSRATELQQILITLQNALELFVDEDGSVRIDVDEYVSTDMGLKNFLVKLLGRGKYEDSDTDAEENVEA